MNIRNKIFPIIGMLLLIQAKAPAQSTQESTAEDRLAEMEARVYEVDAKETAKRVKLLLNCASYAKSNGLPDEAERYYNDVLTIDPFHPKAHAMLGHVEMYECWVTKEEYDSFQETLKQEMEDDSLKGLRRSIFDNNTQVGRQALQQFASVSQVWVIDTAYDLMYRTNDVFMEDIAIEIFGRWAGDRARDVWIKRISRSRNVGGALKMLDQLRSSMTEDLKNPATKFVLREVLAKRNENISLKCLDLLAGVNSDEIKEILRKFMPRCNNQNVKQKLLQMVF